MNLKHYRPTNLNEFIGQEDIKFNLNIYLNASLSSKTTLDHILINGPSGVGKTSLAIIVSNTLNANISFIQGSHLKKISDLLNVFSLLNKNDIIFIDECHMIDKTIFELLYTIMEDFVIDIPIGPDNNQKINRLKLPKFTLICATNFLNKLPNSFIDRFPIQFYLNWYNEQDIYNILKQILDKENISIENEHLKYLASISKNNPRNAINLLKRYLDFFNTNEIKNNNIENIFNKIGVFASGLTKLDIDYLKIINSHKNISLQGISQNLSLDKASIENKIENYLIKNNFININSKGRSLTSIGIAYLEKLNIK